MVAPMSWFCNPRTKMTIVTSGYIPGRISLRTYRRIRYIAFTNMHGGWFMSQTPETKDALKILQIMTCGMQ